MQGESPPHRHSVVQAAVVLPTAVSWTRYICLYCVEQALTWLQLQPSASMDIPDSDCATLALPQLTAENFKPALSWLFGGTKLSVCGLGAKVAWHGLIPGTELGLLPLYCLNCSFNGSMRGATCILKLLIGEVLFYMSVICMILVGGLNRS